MMGPSGGLPVRETEQRVVRSLPVDVRALEYKEIRSLLMLLLMNQKSLIDAMRIHAEQDHESGSTKEFSDRLRRLDNRLERFLDELSHISALITGDNPGK